VPPSPIDPARLAALPADVRALFRAQEAMIPVGRSKSPGYGHLKLPHLMIAVSAAEQQ